MCSFLLTTTRMCSYHRSTPGGHLAPLLNFELQEYVQAFYKYGVHTPHYGVDWSTRYGVANIMREMYENQLLCPATIDSRPV
jgi:hypothetical protein